MALKIFHVEDLPEAREVRPQEQNGRKAAVHIRQIERSEDRTLLRTFYDPGLVLDRHGHMGHQVIYVIEGDLMVGEFPAREGSTIILEKGTAFGPLRAGENGATILEIFLGPNASSPAGADPEGYKRLLAEEGITLLPESDPTVQPVLEQPILAPDGEEA